MIVVLAGEKGGCGKSALAQNIAVYFKTVLVRDVLLLDCDPQETSSDWADERNSGDKYPAIDCLKGSGDITGTLDNLASKYDDIVIDCAGADSNTGRSAMVSASHILIPFRPKRRDLKTLPTMEGIISLVRPVNPGVKVASIITQCPSLPNQAYRILEAKEACSSFGIPPLNTITYTRNIYDDSDESGASVLEIDTDAKASAELHNLVKEFLEV